MDLWIFNVTAPAADTRIKYGEGEWHFGDLRLPEGDGPHPVCIVIHGGFWRTRFSLEHLGHLCADLTIRGVATWSLEYRRIGHEGGGWPGTLQDVAQGADHLRILAEDYNLDLSRVITLGHSAGGHLALWLAARSKIDTADPLYSPQPLPLRAAISLAGVCDLRQGYNLNLSNGVVGDLMGGSPDQFPARYASASPAALLPLGIRQFLIHGTDDKNVPFEISRDYAARAVELGDPATLITLPNAEHFEVVDPHSAEWPAIVNAVLINLAPGAVDRP